MFTVTHCSGCTAPLQPPPGATSFSCPFCFAVTRSVAYPPPAFFSPAAAAPPRPPPPPVAPAPGGRKKAVICGVSYLNDVNNKLGGSMTDAKYMKHLLITKFHFPADNILMLTEEETYSSWIPTKQNIIIAMKWLVSDCQRGDSLVFHFSGHGLPQKDRDGDEVDGFDESLCPLDFESQGVILDDDINEMLVRPLLSGVKLHAIIDACHSGTALDLPFLCRMNRSEQYVWEDHRPPSGVWKGSSGGEAICFSGCDDNQESFDSAVISTSAVPSGVMTRFFVEAIEYGHSATYGSILNYIRSCIRSIGNDHGQGGIQSLPSITIAKMRQQEPQLTSCEAFDVYAKTFSM